MEHILQSAWEGLMLVLSWPNLLYPVLGTMLAMMVASVPGISGGTLMALALSITVSWDPLPILLLFGAFIGGGTFMGSFSAILVNIPGTAPNAATLFDGYPMAQQGKAKTALACSASASALGSTFGVLCFIVCLPFLQQAILAIGPAELLMLVIWGLSTIAAIVRGSLLKALAMAGIGLLLAFIGLDPRTAEPRYTFTTSYLQDGLSLVPIFLGLFAIAEMIDLAVKDRITISGYTRLDDLSGNLWEGVTAVFRHGGLFLRSATIGAVVGIIPGIGGTVASFIAYSQAKLTARADAQRFGHGDIRGVLAPEAANDAKDGTSLVPTLAFGIPGSEGTALLLAVFTLHGLTPGQALLTDQLPLVFVLLWSLFLSNWMTSLLGLALINQAARLTLIRTRLLVPFIVVLAAFAALAYRGRPGDVVLAFLFGAFGYYLKKHGWPRITLVIALVLGALFETNLHMTLQLHRLGRLTFWARPIAMALLVFTLLTLLYPTFKARRTRRKAHATPDS